MPLHGFAGQHPRVDPTAWVAPGAQVIGDVEIGAGASVWYNVVVRGDVMPIRIGARSNIQDGSVVHVTRRLAARVGCAFQMAAIPFRRCRATFNRYASMYSATSGRVELIAPLRSSSVTKTTLSFAASPLRIPRADSSGVMADFGAPPAASQMGVATVPGMTVERRMFSSQNS